MIGFCINDHQLHTVIGRGSGIARPLHWWGGVSLLHCGLVAWLEEEIFAPYLIVWYFILIYSQHT